MEKYFGFAKELLDEGLAVEADAYGEDNVYDTNITSTTDFSFYRRLAEQCNGKILDIGCGTGRILKHLLENGFDEVVGMDLSSDMLGIAQKKLGELGFSPTLIEADMRDFSLREEFSLVIIPNCSMIYISTDEDRRKVFQAVYKHLQSGGTFAFDFDAETVSVSETKPWISSQTVLSSSGEIILSTAQIKGIHKNLRLVNMVNYKQKSPNHSSITVNASFEATCEPEKMKQLLESEGFLVKGFYGDYHYSPYEGGELCVVVAVKK